ncbi:toxin-antitoxin system HicB family antitoxin [Rhizobium laguerreae]|uniref:toxin-antitoxin system HicB family antitoxin n=1 Tax=Rhizobium laguerreae TaxID=1076926 RepID=UPI00143FA7AA|nr:toxin-antitoxin system HicB family antitoxin [Rhizobium laguerreae]
MNVAKFSAEEATMPVWTKMTLRLPLAVHTALTRAAQESDVSLNQLIVDRLNSSVGGAYVSEEEANSANLLERLDRLERQVSALQTPEKSK